MVDYAKILNQGYIREEKRLCEVFFTDTTLSTDKKLIALQEELERHCPEPITFEITHKVELDHFGNVISGVYLKENTKQVKGSLAKLREENEYLKSLPDESWSKINFKVVSAYETKFTSKGKKLF